MNNLGLICNKCVDVSEYIKISNLPEDDTSVEAEIQKRLEKRE